MLRFKTISWLRLNFLASFMVNLLFYLLTRCRLSSCTILKSKQPIRNLWSKLLSPAGSPWSSTGIPNKCYVKLLRNVHTLRGSPAILPELQQPSRTHSNSHLLSAHLWPPRCGCLEHRIDEAQGSMASSVWHVFWNYHCHCCVVVSVYVRNGCKRSNVPRMQQIPCANFDTVSSQLATIWRPANNKRFRELWYVG